MAIPKESSRTTLTTSAGAWSKVFSSPSPDRSGVGLFLSPSSALDGYVRIRPLGSSAPAGFSVDYADFIIYKGETRYLNEFARGDVDIWLCGADNAGGACTMTAWEVLG
jgi:hypothetical protein